ncbi:hypothetical protein Agabi119p4_1107 [Agaricus bisporus var. burnettii]|uniref:F-box domain-containing protein n=1 Tax=Agaricus bisporus var. burnettii TaxID=192524 RepID=A0A8H7FBU5_AGABI|nr:hypothetical protein Agabi119p4_1107 [Agaricus bisporus var. burnettii]
MACLPVELLDEIFSLAIAQGAISPNEASYICRRWRTFQKLLFKSVKLDPFDENILDLDEHSHLTLYIEELRVFPRLGSSTRSNSYDISPSFANFLRNLHNLSSMVFCDSRIQWADVSCKNIDAFLTIFQRDAFCSLEVSVHKPLPSWMLLQGLHIASKLTIHHIGRIIPPPEFEKPVPNFQSSLTHLVLLGNAVQRTAEFCLQQRNLAKILLRKLTHLVLEYAETYGIFAPPMAPFVEKLLIFSGSQLEALEIRVSSPYAIHHIPESALVHLKSLQRLTIHFTGYSANDDTLGSATEYLKSFFHGLPSRSHLASFSLRVDERVQIYPNTGRCMPKCQQFLQHICEQLSCTVKWPRLNSCDILVEVHDDNFLETTSRRKTINMDTRKLKIDSLLRVNASNAEQLRSSVIPLMG